jgi:hypothetical protein
VIAAAGVNDVRAWFEIPEVVKVFSAAGTQCQSLFIGELTVVGMSPGRRRVDRVLQRLGEGLDGQLTDEQ